MKLKSFTPALKKKYDKIALKYSSFKNYSVRIVNEDIRGSED